MDSSCYDGGKVDRQTDVVVSCAAGLSATCAVLSLLCPWAFYEWNVPRLVFLWGFSAYFPTPFMLTAFLLIPCSVVLLALMLAANGVVASLHSIRRYPVRQVALSATLFVVGSVPYGYFAAEWDVRAGLRALAEGRSLSLPMRAFWVLGPHLRAVALVSGGLSIVGMAVAAWSHIRARDAAG